MSGINVFMAFGKISGAILWVKASRSGCTDAALASAYASLIEVLEFMRADLLTDLRSQSITMEQSGRRYRSRAIGSAASCFKENWLDGCGIRLSVNLDVLEVERAVRPILDVIEQELGIAFAVTDNSPS